jgi:superkiller protein 3
MEKKREDRYQNCSEIVRELRRFAEGVPIHARRTALLTRAWRRLKRHKVRASLAAAVVLLGVVGGVLALNAAREKQRWREAEYARLLALAGDATGRSASEDAAGHGESARACYTRAIAVAPERPGAYWLRALSPGASLEVRLADIDAAEARGLAPGVGHLMRAYMLRMRGRHEQADEERKLAALHDDVSPASLYAKARLLEADGMTAEASALLQKVIDSSDAPTSVLFLAHRARAELRRESGDWPGALDDYLAVRSLGDHGVRTSIRIAAIWRELGNPERSEALYVEALRNVRAEQSPETWARLCRSCDEIGNRAWVQRAAEEGLETYPEAARICFWLGRASTDPESQLAYYDRALELDGTQHDFLEWRAEALKRLGRQEEALASLDHALELKPSCPVAHMRRGIVLATLGRAEESLAAYDRALELDPFLRGAHMRRGHLLRETGRAAEALAAYDAAIALRPLAGAFVCRGLTLTMLGRDDEALEALGRAVELNPRRADTYYIRGDVLRRLRRFEEALVDYEQGLRLRDGATHVWTNMGVVLERLGRYDEALQAHGRALEIDGDNYNAYLNRGALLTNRMSRHEEAVADFESCIELDPERLAAYWNKGIACERLGRDEGCRVAFEKACDLEPRNAQAWYQLGRSLARLLRHAEAAAAYRRSLDLDPKRAIVWAALGMSRSHLDRDEEAVEAYDRAIALDASCYLAHYERGCSLASLGRREEALAAYRRAAAIRPDSTEALLARADTLMELDRPKKALPAYDAVLAVDPGCPSAWHNKGLLLHWLGRQEEAVASFDRALALAPNVAYAHTNRGRALAALGRNAEALAAHSEALRCDPGYWKAHHLRAFLLWRLQRYQEGLAEAEKGIESGPIDPAFLNDVAWTYVTAPDPVHRNPERALVLVRKALERAPRAGNFWNTLGVALVRTGEWNEAIRALTKSMELQSGGNAYDWLFLAMAHARLGELEEANDYFDRSVAWMEEKRPADAELVRFRAETEAVLGIEGG